MRAFLSKLSLASQGLKYKLRIAFVLMSVIPLLVLGYIFATYGDFFDPQSALHVSILALVSLIIAWLGFLLAKYIVEPIIDLSIAARGIADGDFEKKITVMGDDEIGALGKSINLMVRRIKDNMTELRDYGEKTKEINLEIQRKMVVLAGLLHIGDAITSAADLDKVVDIILGKLSDFYEQGYAICYLSKGDPHTFLPVASRNISDPDLLESAVILGNGFLGNTVKKKKTVVIDNTVTRSSDEYEFKQRHRLANAVIMPICTWNEPKGLLLCGNNSKGFTFTNEDLNILNVFAKQLAIAIENEILATRTKELAIRDDLTGLYNLNYMQVRLDEEIGRAVTYQRPCAFLLIDVDDLNEYITKKGLLESEGILRGIADRIKGMLQEPVDKGGRTGDDEFAVILPEKTKKRAMAFAEVLRRGIENMTFPDYPGDKVTVSIGVSENPLDGSSADQLMARARQYVHRAKRNGKNRVEG
ncbi:MAG: diguanylate cyclase [Candidatus Omnitrophota bacterium]